MPGFGYSFGFRRASKRGGSTAPALNALAGSFTLAEDAGAGALAGALTGTTASSALSLFDNAGGRVALSGSTIIRGVTALDYETATSHSFIVRETLSGYANSPNDTALTLNVTNVFEAPSLAALTLSASTISSGAAPGTVVGAIQGATAGSTLSLFDDAGGRFAISGGNLVAGLVATNASTASSHPVTIRETLADSANSPRDSVLTISVAAAYTLPGLTTAKYDGDSRTASIGGRSVAGSALTTTAGFGTGPNAAGLIASVCGNKWLLGEGFNHAIGASTTLAMLERSRSTSIASTGNPAGPISLGATDGQFSVNSDGAYTVKTQPGSHVFGASVSVNDASGSSAAYYNSPQTASQTLATLATYANELGAAGKVWYIGNELPRGRKAFLMESRTVNSGSCTASETSNFVDGESYGAPGVIGVFASGHPRYCTKVASAPGQDQYTVSAGVYTFGGTAPVTANISYTAANVLISPSTLTLVVHEWMTSSAANFVSTVNSVNYGVPGLLYNRPWVRVFDSWNALLDTGASPANMSLPGTMDNLQLHHTIYGAYKNALAAKAKLDADYPSAPSIEQRPIRNNWYAARGINSGTTYSGTLPPSMRAAATGGSAAPTLIAMSGVPIGKVDTSTGAITGAGIASGTLNFSTGAWSITFTTAAQAPLNAQIWFEQDIGNYDLTTMTEGTIGRNALMNGMMDMTAASGSNLSSTIGASSITGITASQIPYGWTLLNAAFNTAIGNGTASVTVASVTTGDGYPRFSIDIEGSHTAATGLQMSNVVTNASARVVAGDKAVCGARICYDQHGTIGKFYGTQGCQSNISFQHASYSVNSPSGLQAITITSARNNDGGTGMYIDDTLLNAAGGELDLYRLSSQVDLTGRTPTTTTYTLTINSAANVPFAGRFGFGQCQVRKRNDV
ncbi:MAG: hypothetical protein ABIT04_04250 [Novosphingobium sp.]